MSSWTCPHILSITELYQCNSVSQYEWKCVVQFSRRRLSFNWKHSGKKSYSTENIKKTLLTDKNSYYKILIFKMYIPIQDISQNLKTHLYTVHIRFIYKQSKRAINDMNYSHLEETCLPVPTNTTITDSVVLWQRVPKTM